MNATNRIRLTKMLFIAPASLFLFLILIFPILYTLFQSFYNKKLTQLTPPKFVGFDNYVRALQNPEFWNSVQITVTFTVLALAMQTVLGVALGLLYHQTFKGRGLLRTLAIMPMAAAPVSVALIFVMMFNPTIGVLNYLLEQIGLPKSLWIYDSHSVVPSLALVDTWQYTPILMIMVMAGLASLPSEVFEQAKIDGARGWQTLWHILLPMLRPFIVAAVVFRLNDALKTFDTVYVMTQGGPGNSSEMLNIYLYNQAFAYFNTGYASAIVILFTLLVLLLVSLLIRGRRAN